MSKSANQDQPKATITVTIAGDPPQYVAKTPHVPGIKAEDPEEYMAVNRLIEKIRAHRRRYENQGAPVPWAPAPMKAAPKDMRVLRLTGVAPANTTQPKPTSRRKTQ